MDFEVANCRNALPDAGNDGLHFSHLQSTIRSDWLPAARRLAQASSLSGGSASVISTLARRSSGSSSPALQPRCLEEELTSGVRRNTVGVPSCSRNHSAVMAVSAGDQPRVEAVWGPGGIRVVGASSATIPNASCGGQVAYSHERIVPAPSTRSSGQLYSWMRLPVCPRFITCSVAIAILVGMSEYLLAWLQARPRRPWQEQSTPYTSFNLKTTTMKRSFHFGWDQPRR